MTRSAFRSGVATRTECPASAAAAAKREQGQQVA